MYKVKVTLSAGTITWSTSYVFADQQNAAKFQQLCTKHGYQTDSERLSGVVWEPKAALENLNDFASKVM